MMTEKRERTRAFSPSGVLRGRVRMGGVIGARIGRTPTPSLPRCVAGGNNRTTGLIHKSPMQIPDRNLDLAREPRRILIEQFTETLDFPFILTEHRDVVRLRELVQLRDRSLRLGFKTL